MCASPAHTAARVLFAAAQLRSLPQQPSFLGSLMERERYGRHDDCRRCQTRRLQLHHQVDQEIARPMWNPVNAAQ